MNIEDIDPTPIVAAVVVTVGGVWKYLTSKHEMQHAIKVKELEASEEHQESLIERIKAMGEENKESLKKVEQLQTRVLDISIELATSKEKIKHLEEEVLLYELRKKIETMGKM